MQEHSRACGGDAEGRLTGKLMGSETRGDGMARHCACENGEYAKAAPVARIEQGDQAPDGGPYPIRRTLEPRRDALSAQAGRDEVEDALIIVVHVGPRRRYAVQMFPRDEAEYCAERRKMLPVLGTERLAQMLRT
ncbi:hypothetical protein [Streptomyces pseudovenezuelae]|uniref:hypothetical protein n=1 Tax=Streptomyces pseudovenezuelae TaxID=67350 RepID=UPI0036EEFFCF